jgi:two-component system, cell cycle response regulator DivK
MVAPVLVVEDNPLNLKLIKDVLEYRAFDVLTAASGEEGVVAALGDSPDLVLMDLQLPGIDGQEALLRIRADPRCGGIPVVAVTYVRCRASSPASCPAGSMAEPITVLAMDDQPPNLGLLDAVLSPRGCRVSTAAPGEDAVELLMGYREATRPVGTRVWLAAEHEHGVFLDDAGDRGDAGHRRPIHRGGGPVARDPGERRSSNWLHPGRRPAHGRCDHRAGGAAQRQCGRVPDA